MLVGPDESYRLDKRFSCTVNCETEKDRLREFGVVVMVVVPVAVAVGIAEGRAGTYLFAANRIPPVDKRYGFSFVSSRFSNTAYPALFWGIMRRRVVIVYRRCGTAYRSHLAAWSRDP
jgi:hypothetical protein